MMPSHVALGELTKIRTGKLDANASSPDGEFPFFTCASEPLRIASYSYDCECVLVAGNGDLNVKYYEGKFDAYQRTYIIETADLEKLNTRYLYHFMDSYLSALREQSIGGIIKYIKIGNLTGAQIPLPPLPEQRRIAAILDKADALRAKRREAIVKLDQLLQSVFLEMFGDPVTNPKGWPVGALGDLIHAAKDGPHVSPKYSESGIPFLSTRHIRAGSIRWGDLKYISQEEAEIQWKKCRPERGDILFTKGGTTGLAAAVETDAPFAVWVHVALLKTNFDKADPTWLTAMLNSQYCFEQSQHYTHGIANRDLGLKRMVKIKLLQPPLKTQNEYAELSKRIAAKREIYCRAETGYDALLSSLQQSAFAGTL